MQPARQSRWSGWMPPTPRVMRWIARCRQQAPMGWPMEYAWLLSFARRANGAAVDVNGMKAVWHPHGDARDARSVSNQKRSEEHTSELQSLMRISYAVFCLKKKN